MLVKLEEDIFGVEGGIEDDKTPHEEVGFENINCGKEIGLIPSTTDPPNLELKEVPRHLEYAFREKNSKLPLIIAPNVLEKQKEKLLDFLKKHKSAVA